MQPITIFIRAQAERFDQWFIQWASEHGYTLSVERERDMRRYRVKVNGQDIAEVDTFPVGNRLQLRAKRQGFEIAPDGKAVGGFLEILSADLTRTYQAEPIENGIDFLTYWIADSYSDVQFDDPKEEAKRQALVAELRRGLPPIAPIQPPTLQEQPPVPTDAPKEKRFLGLRIDYLIAGIILGIIISGISFLLFPDWARSNSTLVILFPFAFAAATSFLANFRKAYE